MTPSQQPMLEPANQDGVCVLRLRAPAKNALTFELLAELQQAIDQAVNDPSVRGIVLTGDAGHFSAGADIHLFDRIVTAQDAISISQTFQEAFQHIEGSSKPVMAAVAGTVLGGALELAMACHYRVAASGSRFHMPEVTLAINPGAGGTQRLPRLVGVEAALRMLLTAEKVGAEKALKLGLIDATCPADEIVSTACAMLQECLAPRHTCQLTAKVAPSAARDEAFQRAWQQARGARPELVAPARIVTAVETGVTQSIAAGMRCERQGFADCMKSAAARNKIYLFFATRRATKLADLESVRPRSIQTAGVVGMGTMGTGIAQTLALSGLPVVVLDENDEALERGVRKIRDSIQKRVVQGRLSADRGDQLMGLIQRASSGEALAGADLVIESVFEDLAVKRSVLQSLENLCRQDAVLATNTSTISLDELAAGMRRPERLVGMHFFNPAPRMPLVEIVRRPVTPPSVVTAAVDCAKRLRKTPVVVASRPGFLVNRLFIPYLQEAFHLLQEGAAATEIDRAAVGFGFPMGPLVLIDMAGLDILVFGQRVLRHAFPRHGPLSPIATRLAERGHLGQKTGMGVYRYDPGDVTPRASGVTAALISEVQRDLDATPRDFSEREIAERLVLRMVSEGLHVIEERIVAHESDLDVALVLGTGFPDFRGGVLRYMKDVGRDNVLVRLGELAQQCGERFRPPQYTQ